MLSKFCETIFGSCCQRMESKLASLSLHPNVQSAFKLFLSSPRLINFLCLFHLFSACSLPSSIIGHRRRDLYTSLDTVMLQPHRWEVLAEGCLPVYLRHMFRKKLTAGARTSSVSRLRQSCQVLTTHSTFRPEKMLQYFKHITKVSHRTSSITCSERSSWSWCCSLYTNMPY